MIQITPTVTDYRGHHRTLFHVLKINLKAYADAILIQIAWPALGIEPRAIRKQPLKSVTYCVKPQGQGILWSVWFVISTVNYTVISVL